MVIVIALGVAPLVIGLALLSLGIVTLVKDKKAGTGAKTGSILFTVFGGVLTGVGVVGLIVGLASAGTGRYARKAKTSEAVINLDKIYQGAAAYYSSPKVNEMGAKLPCQFPETVECTPYESPCSFPDKRFPGDPMAWEAPTWRALMFEMYDAHYFRYCFESDGTGSDAIFTASAFGDLDCDGIESTFKRFGRAAQGSTDFECSVEGLSTYIENETE